MADAGGLPQLTQVTPSENVKAATSEIVVLKLTCAISLYQQQKKLNFTALIKQ